MKIVNIVKNLKNTAYIINRSDYFEIVFTTVINGKMLYFIDITGHDRDDDLRDILLVENNKMILSDGHIKKDHVFNKKDIILNKASLSIKISNDVQLDLSEILYLPDNFLVILSRGDEVQGDVCLFDIHSPNTQSLPELNELNKKDRRQVYKYIKKYVRKLHLIDLEQQIDQYIKNKFY